MAQDGNSPVLKLGTVYSYRGVMVPEGKCTEHVPYEQFAKVSGQLILPDTKANVYSYMEYWGRDSGEQVLRISPRGDAFIYFRRTEYVMSSMDEVGSSFTMTDPESGATTKLVVAEDGITVVLPTGAVYDNMRRMDTYCLSCGPDPVLVELRWYNRQNPMGVLFKAPNPGCWARWHWLVDVSRK
jgi:hypothetical protein